MILNYIRHTLIVLLSLLPWLVNAQVNVSATSGCVPLNVTFSTSNTASNYAWTFSNGVTSSSSSPVISFMTAGVYSVTVTVGSNSYTLDSAVTVHASPTPEISVSSDSACVGDSVFFECSGSTNSSFTWDMKDGTVTSGNGFNYAYTGSGSYWVFVQETDQNGCSSSTTVDRSVVALAKPNTNFGVNSSLFCSTPAHVYIEAVDTSISNFTWTVNNDTVEASHSLDSVLSNTGIYDVSLQATSSFGCSSTHSDAIQLVEAVQPDFSGIDTVGCTPFTFDYSSISGFGQIHWHTSAGDSSDSQESFEIQQAGTYDLAFSGVDSFGCQVTDSLKNVVALPTPEASFTVSDTLICDAGFLTLTAQSNNGCNHEWIVGQQSYSGDSITCYQSLPGYHDFSYSVTNLLGCSDIVSREEYIKVESAQTLSSMDTVEACAPHSVELEHSNIYIQNTVWIIPEVDTVSGNTATFDFNEAGSFDLITIGSSISGCTDTTTFEDIFSIDELDIEYPGYSTINLCHDSSQLFNGTLISNSCSWDFGDNTSSNDSIVSHTYNQPGTFVVSLSGTSVSGCAFTIDTHTIVRVSNLNANYTINILDCEGLEASFEALCNEAVSWDWNVGGATSLSNPFNHTFSSTGPFNLDLTVTDSLGCSRTASSINALNFFTCGSSSSASGSAMANSSSPNNWGVSSTSPIEGCVPANLTLNSPLDSNWISLWYFGDGDSALGNQVTHQYDSAATYDLTVLNININSSDTDTIVFDNAIKIGDPSSNFTIQQTSLCEGTHVQIENLSQLASSWVTDFDEVYQSGLFEPAYTFDTAGYFTIALTASDTLGCSATSYQQVSAGHPNQELSLPPVLCGEDSVTLDHNIQHYEQYVWQIGSQSYYEMFPTVSFSTNGVHNLELTVTDTAGCETSYFTGTEIAFYDPTASFQLPFSLNNCDSIVGTIQNNSTNASEYRWFVNEVLVSLDYNLSLNLQDTGTYKVMLRAGAATCYSNTADTLGLSKAQAHFTYVAPSFCLPDTVSFIDQSTGAVQWSWDVGVDSTYQSASPDVVFHKASKDSMTLSITDSNGCSASHTEPPIAFLDVGISYDVSSACAPASITLNDTLGMATSLAWTIGGVTQTGNPVNFTLNNSGSYSVQVVATHSSGCTSVFEENSLFSIQSPKANFGVDNDGMNCAPLVVTVNDSSENCNSWKWDFGDNTTSNEQHPKHVYHDTGSFDISLIVTSADGCTDSFKMVNAVEVTGPKANFTASPEIICTSLPVSFNNEEDSLSSFLWTFGDGHTSSEQNPTHTYKEEGVYSIALLVSDSAGCSDYHVSNIKSHKTPKIDVSIETVEKCIPALINVKNNSQSLQNPTYTWKIDSNTIIAGGDTFFELFTEGHHSLTLTLSNDNGCSAVSIISDEVIVYDTIDRSETHLSNIKIEERGVSIEYEVERAFGFKNAELYAARDGAWSKLREGTSSTLDALDSAQLGQSVPACFKINTQHECAINKLETVPAHCSVHLDVVKKQGKRALQWTPFPNASFEAYDILVGAQRRAPYKLIGTVAPDVLEFVDTLDHCPGLRDYVIEVRSINGTSNFTRSNFNEVKVDTLNILTQPIDVDLVSVIDNEAIAVQWKIPEQSSNLITGYQLVRKSSTHETQIMEIDTEQTLFMDYDVSPANASYHYILQPVNVCGINTIDGASGNSILLEHIQTGQEVELQWNSYKEWENQYEYKIQIKNEDGLWETIQKAAPADTTTHIDLIDID